ncbi:hypothetical protein PISMIDRAFT_335889 [Pisolithus microcarpus 441]|uniref:Uncharacterized protein n=1 Tax=Pisolithus microcarpus 441 TaxID=765257 RepID=A0A0C9Z537_9AGAM|nr:LIM-domain binding protein-domain-containing protein [Pisolithus microcarpus]KIK15113.1 hypothetical protein PISMIDRAFT_335889 [Pisolithus microcarpus 441]
MPLMDLALLSRGPSVADSSRPTASIKDCASYPGGSQLQPPMVAQTQVVISPSGFGQGHTRLLQLSNQLSSEDQEIVHQKHRLLFWDNLVKDYFTSSAVMKITLWKDNQRVEAKPLEIISTILPRFFQVTTQAGVKSMTFSFEDTCERLVDQALTVVECGTALWTYNYTNGYIVTLRGPLVVHMLLCPIPGSSSTPPQRLQHSLKIGHFQFDANTHEKFIFLNAITGSRIIAPPMTPKARNDHMPSPNSAPDSHRTKGDEKWEEHRVLINNASMPGAPVNLFGIPQMTMRSLEIAEGVTHMTELMAFARENDQGPIEALKQMAQRIREGHYQVNGV